MGEPAPNPELLRSLGRLVRGLSALFWGLPLALVVCVGTASAGWFRPYGVVPLLAVTGLLLYGVHQLDTFQRQERPWRSVVDRARLLALINCGLSPFVFWWNGIPGQAFFGAAVAALMLCGLFFLYTLNVVLLRLGTLLPDEALRTETRQYTPLNRNLLIAMLAITITYLLVTKVVVRLFPNIPHVPEHVDLLSLQIAIPALDIEIYSGWFVWLLICALVLLPLSMTMALIWKTKEVILENVFGFCR
jgi:hypothetical protein